MSDPTSANYVFLPWVRQGAASGIQTPDSLSENQAGVVSVPVKLRVNNTDDIDRQVRLYGPGDVTGLDPQQVVRTEPRHLAMDFEPNYFPAIEFDRPDFPWLFTPAKADAAGRLRPWLCLVVVRKQEGVTLRVDRNLPLPVLEIKAPARPEGELPDLSESWAWVHAQVAGSQRNATSLKASLAGDPTLTVSRLLCPRRLDPATEYLACLVPAFELGRRAGLGLPIQPAVEQRLEPAWASGTQSPPQVTLPVYFHWEFRTGAGGDFEALVGLLEARDMPPEVGRRRMDISQPGFKILPPLPPGTMLELEGALRVPDAPTAEWPERTRTRFQAELKMVLDAPWEAMKQENKEPLVAPPIYGGWQAARHTVEISPPPPVSTPWLDELNLDPRHRAVAALGTQVVQTQQEQLMASAWEQLGEIERINQMRRQAQLSRAVNTVYHAKHFTRFSEESLLKVVASAQSRVVLTTTNTNARATTRMLLSTRISQSAIPSRAVSAPLRRLTSPRGPISTRFLTVGAPPISIVAQFNAATPVQPEKKEAGMVTINQVSSLMPGGGRPDLFFEETSRALNTTTQFNKFRIAAEGDVTTLLKPIISHTTEPDSPDAQAFRQAAQAHQDYLVHQVFMSFWQDFKFVFSGGNGIIYAVDQQGRLLFYRDVNQDGTGEIPSLSVISQSGWQDFKFVFSGGNGIIYAVDQQGRLLFYRDTNQDGTGDVANPSVIGQGGWQRFKFVFGGGNGIIYAVDQGEGFLTRLLFYRDTNQDGTGDVANPSVISQGNWGFRRSVFSGGNGIIYSLADITVAQIKSPLLFQLDRNQDGTGEVTEPSIISQDEWKFFKFVFSGGNGTIYAVGDGGKLLFTRDHTQNGTGIVRFPTAIGPGKKIFSASPMNLSDTKDKLLQSVNPETTINARVKASLIIARGAEQTGDPLEPILDAPDFPQPMYEALRDLSQDFLFPGLEHVPPNTITLLKTNPTFVESFLVGLNAEMSSELLWRNYPTDQRGTYFRRFWDRSAGDDQFDIEKISKWGDRELGKNARAGGKLVLLLRGELLRRYPNSVIYAVAAVRKDGQLNLSSPPVERHPVFRGTLKPDVTFLGFDLKCEDAIADPGWFFVIQEQPTEPRFGLDAADFDEPLPAPTKNNLSWRHLAKTEDELKALAHASVKTVLPDIDKAKWGRNSAHQAYITLQRPVRIAIHAREMIKHC